MCWRSARCSRGLFSLSQLTDSESGVDPYVIAMAADITGPVDAELLRRCAAALLARHPNLRASFISTNATGGRSKPVQVIPNRVEVPWRHITATADEVEALDADERLRPFDLARGPAIRFLLVELSSEHWRLVVVAHHIIIDGWSLPLFVGELITLYRSGGDADALPPPPRPYRDYIGWLAGRDPETSRALWREHFSGLDGPTLLTPALTVGEPPLGQPRRTELDLDSRATGQLAEAARARGVTVNTLVQMAWATLLSAFTDRSDVVFGVTVSGRPSELAGVETMVGLFINTVPLRVRLDPAETVGAQCLAVQREAAKLRDHSYLAHSEVRSLAGIGEMFDTLLVYENFPPGGLVGSGEFTANGATFRPAALETAAGRGRGARAVLCRAPAAAGRMDATWPAPSAAGRGVLRRLLHRGRKPALAARRHARGRGAPHAPDCGLRAGARLGGGLRGAGELRRPRRPRDGADPGARRRAGRAGGRDGRARVAPGDHSRRWRVLRARPAAAAAARRRPVIAK